MNQRDKRSSLCGRILLPARRASFRVWLEQKQAQEDEALFRVSSRPLPKICRLTKRTELWSISYRQSGSAAASFGFGTSRNIGQAGRVLNE
ncbi:hypothetical protein C5Y93_07335 [Blastopirellula marina]|uniref:Uncharacterized protein n=1 Tax=Blastopirellula marina TaxID=124 RepID=A0A2S8GQC4_9BACT|nr:hypothetical protein C5Y93_07335 [Blastopirellula marina]